jgi:peroxiredoxin
MAQLEPLKEHIEQLGAGLVYIAAEKRKGVWNPAKYLSEHPVLFPFLLDENRSVTKAYGLYHAFGHDAFRIAHPATLIVDRSGMLRYIYRGENQTDRAPVEEVLDALRKTSGYNPNSAPVVRRSM